MSATKTPKREVVFYQVMLPTAREGGMIRTDRERLICAMQQVDEWIRIYEHVQRIKTFFIVN
jgi:hypothetical protein